MGRPRLDPERDWEKILDVPARRAIVRACRHGPRTAREVAGELGRAAPGVEPTMVNLRDWGFLTDAGKSPRGANRYTVTRDGINELRRWMRSHQPEFPRRGQHVVLIQPPNAAVAAARLVDEGLVDEVEWAVSLGHDQPLIIGLVETSGTPAAQRMASAIAGHAEVRAAVVADVIQGDQLEVFVRGARANFAPQAA